MANLQLAQPHGSVLARSQNNHNVLVAAAQFKVMPFETENLDSSSAKSVMFFWSSLT